MLNESLELMLVGMGTVFVFLTVLVLLLQASAAFFASWKEAEEPVPVAKKQPTSPDHLIEIAIALAAIERSDS